jgi:hypothetical protein
MSEKRELMNSSLSVRLAPLTGLRHVSLKAKCRGEATGEVRDTVESDFSAFLEAEHSSKRSSSPCLSKRVEYDKDDGGGGGGRRRLDGDGDVDDDVLSRERDVTGEEACSGEEASLPLL